jgi:predicted Zn-dependent protease
MTQRLVVCLFMTLVSLAHADIYTDVTKLLKNGKKTEALELADRYLTDKPKDPQMRFIKAGVLSEMQQTAAAADILVKLTQDYPELPEPYNNLAVLMAQKGELDKAREQLELALRNNPHYTQAHENLGDLYTRMAGLSYLKASQLDPKNGAARRKLQSSLQIAPPVNP